MKRNVFEIILVLPLFFAKSHQALHSLIPVYGSSGVSLFPPLSGWEEEDEVVVVGLGWVLLFKKGGGMLFFFCPMPLSLSLSSYFSGKDWVGRRRRRGRAFVSYRKRRFFCVFSLLFTGDRCVGRKRGEELEIRISLAAEEKGGDDLFACCRINLGQRIDCVSKNAQN